MQNFNNLCKSILKNFLKMIRNFLYKELLMIYNEVLMYGIMKHFRKINFRDQDKHNIK